MVEETHGVYEKGPVQVVYVIVGDPCLRKGKPVNSIIIHRLSSTFLRFLESARDAKILPLSQCLIKPRLNNRQRYLAIFKLIFISLAENLAEILILLLELLV